MYTFVGLCVNLNLKKWISRTGGCIIRFLQYFACISIAESTLMYGLQLVSWFTAAY